MSWDIKNLYQLMRRYEPNDTSRFSVYQQKWYAKAEVRSYHGHQVIESQFLNRHFSSTLPMQVLNKADREKVPQMQALMFAELERRLDFIVFRCNFAKSVMWARKAVVGGLVKVNGVKCDIPSRRIEDGDLITVSPMAVPFLSNLKLDANGKPIVLENGKKAKMSPDQPLNFSFLPYVGAHIFVPPYLEVDYDTCSAVFLRSPLPQPSRVEIPSPFHPKVHQLAFEHYTLIDKRRVRPKPKIPLVINGQTIRLKPKFFKIVGRDQANKISEKKKANARARTNVRAEEVKNQTK